MKFDFARNFLDRISALLNTLRDRIGGPVAAIREKVHLPRFPQREVRSPNSRALIFGIAGAAAVLIVCVVTVLTMNTSRRNAAASLPLEDLYRIEIPPEELFLPEEPEFLPRILLERERRNFWTLEDAEPFWTDPMIEGRGFYERIISRVVDGIMERAP